MRRRNFYNKGRKDGRRKSYSPPSKGTSWKATALLGAAIGAIGGPGAAVLGGILGSLAGDSDAELRRKRQNRGAYNAGNRSGRRRRRKRTAKVVVVYRRRRR